MSDATFPAIHAEIFSNHEAGKPVADLIVVDRRTRFRDGVFKPENVIRRYREYSGSLGAHCADWTTGDGTTDTPEGVFAFLCLDQLSDRESIRKALAEFGKIKECEWARGMLKALDQLEGKDDSGN